MSPPLRGGVSTFFVEQPVNSINLLKTDIPPNDFYTSEAIPNMS